MYPIKFVPIYKQCIWGGSNIGRLFNRKLPACPVGESWELSCHRNGTSIVENGFLAGKTLPEVIAEYQEKILGKHFFKDEPFPLLIKIIDARDSLSIQVHPEDAYARLFADEKGKTEAWYVVDALPNAQIVYGVKNDMDKQVFSQAVGQGRVNQAVRRASVKAGDMVLVPAGLVHGLMGGVLVLEVQQSSDITYRIYDYDRTKKDGTRRELHVEQALKVIQFHEQPPMDFAVGKIQCPYFSMQKLIIAGIREEYTDDQFIIYCIMAGDGTIIFRDKEERIHAGNTVLIPACLGRFFLKGRMEVIKIMS